MERPPIPEPVMRYAVPFADVLGHAEPGCEPWRAYGQHQLWIGRYPPGAPPLYLQELHPEGLLEFDKPDFLLHRVVAGTPYRVAHLMGFWHVADEDLLWFQIPRSELTYYIGLAGGSTGLAGDHSIAWYCAECAREICRQDFHGVGHTGQVLSRVAERAVRTFNESAERRRCPACGWEHPLAYPFSPLGTGGGPGPW